MNQITIGTTLWCLPYDTDSVFKPFLKIPFSSFLNQLISNHHFPAYQASIAEELRNRAVWNQKSWLLVCYFEFLNESFDINVWDSHINFIEDNHLRNIMGVFRLWIDTERLYLLNFLKLDSNQFQEDRIFMCFFRTLLFFNTLFNEYMTSDFDPDFLRQFITKSLSQMERMKVVSITETSQIVQAIIQLLINLEKRERVLIELGTLQNLKKSATIKVTKERETLGDVDMRLKYSTLFKKSLDEEKRLSKISNANYIEKITKPIEEICDPILKIEIDAGLEKYGDQIDKERARRDVADQISKYKRKVKYGGSRDENLYSTLDENNSNPYSPQNYQLYGEILHINMDDRQKYQKQNVAEVTSVVQSEKAKTFYDQTFMEEIEAAHSSLGRVTEKDINSRAKARVKKVQEFKHHDENTRVFNLRWHHDPTSRRSTSIEEENEGKDYDNNLLFKSPVEQRFLSNRKNNLDKLKESYQTNSYTMALIQHLAEEIFPQNDTSSRGSTPFVSRVPQVLDVKNFKILNKNKFDFMRKVVGYMAAQKKIQRIIHMKPVPELYPRNFKDVQQQPYNSDFTNRKMDYALGKTDRKPEIYL